MRNAGCTFPSRIFNGACEVGHDIYACHYHNGAVWTPGSFRSPPLSPSQMPVSSVPCVLCLFVRSLIHSFISFRFVCSFSQSRRPVYGASSPLWPLGPCAFMYVELHLYCPAAAALDLAQELGLNGGGGGVFNTLFDSTLHYKSSVIRNHIF